MNGEAKQAGRYIFWGVMTTAVSWITYAIFEYVLGIMKVEPVELSVLIANAISWFCAVAFSFVMNKLFVFDSKSWEPKVVFGETVKFFSTRLAVGLLEIVLVPIIVYIGLDKSVFGIDGFISKIIVTPVIMLLNYFCGKYLVFSNKDLSK